jgi:hypothetical protein
MRAYCNSLQNYSLLQSDPGRESLALLTTVLRTNLKKKNEVNQHVTTPNKLLYGRATAASSLHNNP